jgi:hypothetical protein
MQTFWETMLLFTLKRQGFVQILFYLKEKKCAKYGVDSNKNRNRNQNFSRVGTGTGFGTAINYYVPTNPHWQGEFAFIS